MESNGIQRQQKEHIGHAMKTNATHTKARDTPKGHTTRHPSNTLENERKQQASEEHDTNVRTKAVQGQQKEMNGDPKNGTQACFASPQPPQN